MIVQEVIVCCCLLLQSDSEEAPVLMECVATHDYTGQYEDELAFNAGDTVEVTADSELRHTFETNS